MCVEKNLSEYPSNYFRITVWDRTYERVGAIATFSVTFSFVVALVFIFSFPLEEVAFQSIPNFASRNPFTTSLAQTRS